MGNRLPLNRLFLATMLLPLLAPSAFAQAASDAAGRNVADMKFAEVPGMPTCATASVQSGDPSKGASILLAKMAAGCVFPWHWRTAPNENLMMVSGSGLAEMKGEQGVYAEAGRFRADAVEARATSSAARRGACSM